MEVFIFVLCGFAISFCLYSYKRTKRKENEGEVFPGYGSSVSLAAMIFCFTPPPVFIFIKMFELTHDSNNVTGFIFSSLMSLYFVFMYKRAKRKKGKTKKIDKMDELNEEFNLEESLVIEVLLVIFYVTVTILFFLKMVGLWELLTK